MKIAIVGASGAVGQELLKVLEQRQFPVDRLMLYGSARSAGSKCIFRDREFEIKLLSHDCATDFADTDIAFVSAGGSTSLEYSDMITSGGCMMIDNSSAFRMCDDVPLVVPEVNPEDVHKASRRIIANPNCTTIQMVVALNPLHRISPIRRVHVATYQAASGAGAAAMEELIQQHAALARGEKARHERFAHQLAYNVIPHIDVFGQDDYTREELKMHYETKKIMHAPELEVSATCVRVPVMRAHSEAVWVSTEQPISPEEARVAFASAPGVVVLDDPAHNAYPMPWDLAGCDPVYVGRIRRDLADPRGLNFWCVSDQIRKGAALNAVQIAELLIPNS